MVTSTVMTSRKEIPGPLKKEQSREDEARVCAVIQKE
jgi:hypothetical protein